MRYLAFVAVIAVILMALVIISALRGCSHDVLAPDGTLESPKNSSPEARDDAAARQLRVPQDSTAAAQQGPVTTGSQSAVKSAAREPKQPPSTNSNSTETNRISTDLASLKATVAAADRIASSNPGEAFRLYADAYASAAADTSNPEAAALAESIRPKLRTAAQDANAAADATDDRLLIEQ